MHIRALGGGAVLDVRSKVAYCAQTPWIRHATLEDNIRFGAPRDDERYRLCLKACCLEADLAALVSGDQTEIGEKGINLSGGQKARVRTSRFRCGSPSTLRSHAKINRT